MLLRWGVNPPSPDPCCCCGWLTHPQPQISYCCCVLRVNLFKHIYKGVSPTSLELCSAVVSCCCSLCFFMTYLMHSPVQLLHLSDPVFAKVTKLRRHLLYNLTRSRQTILLHATTVVAAAGAAAAAAAAVVVSCCWWCCCCCCRQLLLVVLQLLLLVLLLLLLVLPV